MKTPTLAERLDEYLRTHCANCHKPFATDKDWVSIPEGEGENLCWEGDGCAWSLSETEGERLARIYKAAWS